MNSKKEIAKLVKLVDEEQLDWFKREICNLHECPLNDGTCMVHNIEETSLWNKEEGCCKIAKILTEKKQSLFWVRKNAKNNK